MKKGKKIEVERINGIKRRGAKERKKKERQLKIRKGRGKEEGG